MVRFGYTLMTEQSGPKQIVEYGARAEQVGFDFEVSSDYFRVDSARVWDAPDGGVPIGLAVSGEKSIERFAPLGDHLIAVEPDADAVKGWDKHHGGLLSSGKSSRKIGQIPICWGTDKDA